MLVRIILLIIFLIFSKFTIAAPVVYKFSGLLSGDNFGLLGLFDPIIIIDTEGNETVINPGTQNPLSVSNAPFEISIFADTENAIRLGSVAGAGSLYTNESFSAKWDIEGIGEISTNRAQVYTLPGIFRVGYGWGGQVFPFTTDEPFEFNRSLFFSGSEINVTTEYGRLSEIVDPTSVILRKELIREGVIPTTYNINLHFSDFGTFTVKDISNVTYSVQPVPLIGALPLFISGLFGLLCLRRNKKSYLPE